MANEAYRAVFLRVHPTGKMVLSLTTEPDGHEAEYAELVAGMLGVPALDVKVVPADTDRFGVGHGYNTSPSSGTSAAVCSATDKILDKARLLAGTALDAPVERVHWADGVFSAAGNGDDASARGRRRRGQDDRRRRDVRPRHRAAAARRRGRPRRPDRVSRLMAAPGTYALGPADGELTVSTGKGGAAARAAHNLSILVQRWEAACSSPMTRPTRRCR